MYKKLGLLLCALSMCWLLQAQRADYDFKSKFDSMAVIMHDAGEAESIAVKENLAAVFEELLVETLKLEGSFNYQLDSLPYVSILRSDDGLVRLFNWSVPANKPGYHHYHCVVQHRAVNGSIYSDVFVLEDAKPKVMLPEQQELDYPDWYGCLYYQLVEKTDGKKVYYTLLGFDFNDGVSYKKYIDVLTFNKKGFPEFGAPIFALGRKPQRRVVLEYTSQSVLLLKYFTDLDKIVFNYLYPIVPEKINDKSYYVPDATYEGLMFKLGKWIKIPTVELRSKDK